MILNTNIVAVAAIVVGLLAVQSNAQEAWRGYSLSCDGHGDCPYESDIYRIRSMESLPYGYANYNSSRSPYQANPGYLPMGVQSGVGTGCAGICPTSQYSSQFGQSYAASSSHCAGGRCPFERNQCGNGSCAVTSPPYAPSPSTDFAYGTISYPDTEYNFGNEPRQQGSFPGNPADQRPQLSNPSFAPGSDFAPNDSRLEPGNPSQMVPPTSTQIMPPPQLPPQPSRNPQPGELDGRGFESGSQTVLPLLPPMSFTDTQSQQTTDDHAGHDHSGHNHNH